MHRAHLLESCHVRSEPTGMGAPCQSTYWPATEAVAAADEDGANPGSSEVVEALGLNGRGSGSVWVWWGVEQRELGSIEARNSEPPWDSAPIRRAHLDEWVALFQAPDAAELALFDPPPHPN